MTTDGTPRPDGGRVDVDVLARSRAVIAGTASPTLTIAVRGEIDHTALNRLDDLLSSLVAVPIAVVVDVAPARCSTGRLLDLLGRFRRRRRDAGHDCRVEGLHAGVVPDLGTLEIADVFAAYRGSRGAPRPDRRPRPRPRRRQAPGP